LIGYIIDLARHRRRDSSLLQGMSTLRDPVGNGVYLTKPQKKNASDVVAQIPRARQILWQFDYWQMGTVWCRPTDPRTKSGDWAAG